MKIKLKWRNTWKKTVKVCCIKMKFNPNSFICCRNLWTHVDGLRSLGRLEGSLDQHMLMCWTWTRWFLLCFPRWQRISYFHTFTCAHSPVWLMWRCCPCALWRERSVHDLNPGSPSLIHRETQMRNQSSINLLYVTAAYTSCFWLCAD